MTHSRTASLAFTARGLGYRHHQAEGVVEEEAVEGFVHGGGFEEVMRLIF
jgi:hypothetical protein